MFSCISTEKKLSSTTTRSNNAVQRGQSSDSFHFVSYVPINKHLFELDGLKKFPLDHGPVAEGESWSEKFRRVITQRIAHETQSNRFSDSQSSRHDIRYNLMAVVPDKRVFYTKRLRKLRENCHIIREVLSCFDSEKESSEMYNHHNYSKCLKKSRAKTSSSSPSSTITSENPLISSSPSDFDTKNSSSTYVPANSSAPLSPSSTTSTDTSSETGSCINSHEIIDDPSESRVTKMFVFKMCGKDDNEESAEPAVAEEPSEILQEEFQPLADGELRTKLRTFAKQDLVNLLDVINFEIEKCEQILREENDKRERYRIDDSRRIHNYDEFVNTFILMLADQKLLPNLIKKAMSGNSEETSNADNGNYNQPTASAFFDEVLASCDALKKRDNIRMFRKNERTSRKRKRRIQGYRSSTRNRSRA